MIPLRDWAVIAGTTAGCAVGALTAGMLLMRLLRGRSVVAVLLVASCAALATVTCAVLVTTRMMFLSEHDSRVVLVVIGLSVVSAVAVALVLGSSVRGATESLAASAVKVGNPAYDAAPSVPTRELRAVATALDDAHLRLEVARAAAEATEKSRRQLVAGMSHDLRTPLAGMRAMVESLEDRVVVDRETVDRYHRQLRVEIDRLAQMVSDLFELARVEGPMQLHLERVGADDLVEAALASADPVARAKGIRLISKTSPGLPVTVDPDEFGRVMRNLLLNAIRHTPNDGTIAIPAGVSESRDGAVSFTVADACGGIPEDDLPRVFETAFRGNAARTTAAHQGGGFGLAIARGIVESHRGVIGVANHGLGCRFEVRLPLASE
jgi:signal transduction histidine kinase